MPIKELFSYTFFNFAVNVVIYLTVALPFFLVFWVFFKVKFSGRRIQEKQRSTKQLIRYELKYSFISILVFTLINVFVYALIYKGYSQIYMDINEYGIPYFIFSFLLMMIVHDTWFFFTHRLLHHPKIFKYVHLVHHQSKDPSPFASFSFHPIEAFIQGFILVIFAFLFPVHYIALIAWQLVEMTLNVVGHSGYEIYPKNFLKNKFLNWKTTSTHHNMHHSKFSGNYALYFTWWDKIFKTEFKDYEETFEEVHHRISKKSVIKVPDQGE